MIAKSFLYCEVSLFTIDELDKTKAFPTLSLDSLPDTTDACKPLQSLCPCQSPCLVWESRLRFLASSTQTDFLPTAHRRFAFLFPSEPRRRLFARFCLS